MSAIPVQSVGTTSLLFSVLLVRCLPQYLPTPSYVWTFLQLVAVQLLVWVFWKVILYPTYFSPLRHLPGPTTGHTFFMGQWGRIMKSPPGVVHEEWMDTVPNDGLIRYLSIFNADRLLITGPKALGEVLVQRSYDFVKPPLMTTGIARLLGIGVLLAEGEEHRTQRRNLLPAFAFRHIKDLHPVFWGKALEFIQALTDEVRKETETEKGRAPSRVVEIGGWTSRVTLDIIGLAGMGQDFGAIQDPNTELNRTYQRVFKPSKQAQILGLLAMMLPDWLVRNLPVAHNGYLAAAAHVIRRTCQQLIRQKQARLQQGKACEVDILSVALQSGAFSEACLIDQLMTFLAAGHETTSSTLTWAVYLLCQHPEAQRRLRAEIHAHLAAPARGEHDDRRPCTTAADIERLPYLQAVCAEVLRLYPAIIFTLRVAVHDTTILQQPVPRGTQIVLVPWAVNRSRALWGPDAKDFRPERWLSAGRANTRGGADSNYSFMTFMHGPRSCIGQAFARAEFACLLAALLGRFRIEFPDPAHPPHVTIPPGIVAKPLHGLEVRLIVDEGW
ncbi:MAG: hypothetical protein M1826_004461 [Phylliscum demangeonii]|nr:MAG: hypothetical protein M1826_004461 [Phylliscum demangeonii]